MADVFISYASEDRERAHALAAALEARGWSVWWDRGIVAGHPADETVEKELEAAKSVVVLWSSASIASHRVGKEAAVGGVRGVLVPALIDAIELPLELRRKQIADLTGWHSDGSHAGLQAVCNGILAAIGAAASRPPTRFSAVAERISSAEAGWRRQHYRRRVLFAVVLVALGLAVYEGFKRMWGVDSRSPKK